MATLPNDSYESLPHSRHKIIPGNDIEMTSEKDGEADNNEQSESHLSGWPLWLLLFGLFLVVLIVTLDISIIAVAIPRITDEFHTIKDIALYASAFLICQCTLLPLAGRTYTYFSFKVCFVGFLLLFEVGSVICGAASSSGMLVAGRAICGLGSSGLINGALAIVNIATPPGKKAIAMGMFMAVASMGQIIGPLAGGGLTEHVSWRWCFYINLPVGGVAFALFIFIRLPPADKKTWTSRTLFWDLDIIGFAIFAPGSVMILLALNWGGNDYAWNSAIVIGMLSGAAAILVIFVFWEIRQQDQAMIPPPIVSLRTVYSSCFTAFFQGGSMLVLMYYIVLWFQIVKAVSPSMSGVYTLPSLLSQVLFAIVSGVAVSKLGFGLPFMLIGNVLGIISYGLLSTFQPSTSTGEWVGYQIIAGTGRGLSLQIPLLVVQSAIPKADMATGTSVLVWCQFLGGSIFLTIAQVVFVSGLRSGLREFAPGLDANAAIDAGATAFMASVPAELRDAVLDAYNKAVTYTFYLGLGLAAASALACLGIWTAKIETSFGDKKERKAEATAGDNRKDETT